MLALRLLLGALLRQQHELLAPHPLEGVVAAGVAREPALVEVDDLLGHPVEKVAVVADQEQGAGVAAQIVLEPEAGLEIEMVGRLVEQQQVGLGEQHRRERHPHPPAAGEAGQRPLLGGLVEAQAGQDRARPRRRGVRADVGEPGLDLGDRAPDRGRVSAARSRRARSGSASSTASRGVALAARRLLRDPADARAAPQAHLAGIRRELAPDQAQERGLAAAVAPDQADPVPGRQVDARLLEQQAAADPQGDVVQMQHGAGDIARLGALPNPRRRDFCGYSRPRLAPRKLDVQL